MSEVRLPSCLEERLTASSALYDEEAGSFPSLEDARSVWRALDLALDTWDLWEVQALAGFLRRLAPALLIQCQTECTPETVHDAVSVASEWQRLCRRTNSDCYPALTTHAYALMQCFAVLKDVDALRQASVCFNEAVGCDSSLVREDSFLVLCAYWTCTAYLARATNSLSDWEANLDIGRRVVAAGPTQLGDRHRLMTNIGVSYVMAEELKGDSQHLAQAVVLFRNAVGIVPNGDSSAYAMHHLGDALSRLGHEQHNLASLAEAEELHRRVLLELEKQEEPPIVGLPLDDMHISTVLHLGVALDSLGTVLIRQYQRTGISGQLEEAIDVQEAAVNFIAGIGEVDLLAAATMNNLANALHLKYQTHNDVNSLDEAVRIHDRTLAMFAPDHPLYVTNLNNAALAYFELFTCRGRVDDVDRAIRLGQCILDTVPETHFAYWMFTDTLSLFFYSKYLVTADLGSFRRGSDLHLTAVEHGALGGLDGSVLPLAYGVMGRRRFHSISDLREAVSIHRDVLEFTPSKHRAHTWILVNYASDMGLLSKETGETDVLDSAIQQCQCALDELLGGETMDVADSDSFPSTRAVNKCKIRATLALLHVLRCSSSPNPSHELETAAAFVEAIVADKNLTPRARLHETKPVLGSIESAAASSPQHASIRFEIIMTRVYTHIIDSLPLIANFALSHSLQLQELENAESHGSNATLHSTRASSLADAVGLLEQARAVFWSQALRVRDPQLDSLPEDIGGELKDLLRSLHSSCDSRPSLSHMITQTLSSTLARSRQSSRIIDLIEEARALPGMNRLFRGYSVSTLLQAAKRGPVVILVDSASEAFALIIKSPDTRVLHVPLPLVNARAFNSWRGCLATLHDARGETRQQHQGAPRAMRITHITHKANLQESLRQIWDSVVVPVIHALQLKKQTGDARVRLHWSPAGRFTFIPIHAAGTYAGAGAQSCSDFFVSSYTPTLAALINTRRQSQPMRQDRLRALLVAEPYGRGFSPLNGVTDEVEAVQRIFASGPTSAVVLTGAGEGVTTDTVLEKVGGANVLHLACHGIQHDVEPLESGFALRNGLLTVNALIDLHLPDAFIAFLSACETAKGDKDQPDQTIHLAAAMLFAGFRHVIATMWTMNDMDGPFFATKFYEELLKNDIIDEDRVAFAVDHAVSQLRARGVSPARWATFVHIGA